MNSQNWNGGNPLFYVDLGEPKDVRTAIHVGRHNHVMKNPIVVASNDLTTWTIVHEEGPDDYSTYPSEPWVRTLAIPAPPVPPPPPPPPPGTVFVYRDAQTRWAPMGRALVGPDADGSFGASLALSAEGTRLAVGAPNVPHDPSAAATGGSGSGGGSSNYWANPDWYTPDTKLLAYFDFTQTSGWDTTRAVDLGPNGNDITYNAYGNAQGTVEYIQTPTLNYLAVNDGEWDMRLELDSTGPVGHTMAMGCWVKLRHGSNGLDTTPACPNGPALWRTATPRTTGTFSDAARLRSGAPEGDLLIENVYDFGIGMESVGQDTWSHSVIGSQKTLDYITAQPDYENTWWCWQVRLTAEGRLETSLDGSPFALAQNGHGTEDLASIELLNINNSADLPDCTLVVTDTVTTKPATRTARCSGTATASTRTRWRLTFTMSSRTSSSRQRTPRRTTPPLSIARLRRRPRARCTSTTGTRQAATGPSCR